MNINFGKTLRIFKNRISTLLTKPFIRIIFFIPPILTVATIIALLVYFSQLPPEIPIYYSRPWGSDQLTNPLYLFLLPIGSLLWYGISIYLIALQTYQYRVFAQLLLIFSFIVSVFASYTVGIILILVL